MIRIRFDLPKEAAVSTSERRVFSALVDGHHALPAIATHCGLSEVAVIDAITSLGKHQLVMFRAGRPFFKFGEHYLDQQGKRVDCV